MRALALCLLMFASSASAELVLIANYESELIVGDSVGQIQNQSKVRDGSTFPIDFQKYRVDVTVVDTGDNNYRASINVMERADGSWYQINVDPIPFSGGYSIPVDFKWNVDDIALTLAISIAPAP